MLAYFCLFVNKFETFCGASIHHFGSYGPKDIGKFNEKFFWDTLLYKSKSSRSPKSSPSKSNHTQETITWKQRNTIRACTHLINKRHRTKGNTCVSSLPLVWCFGDAGYHMLKPNCKIGWNLKHALQVIKRWGSFNKLLPPGLKVYSVPLKNCCCRTHQVPTYPWHFLLA